MSASDRGQKASQRKEKYLWFGYGNYAGGHPTTQLGGGNVRDPSLFEALSRNAKTCFIFAAVALAVLTAVAMLFAWVISAVVR